MCSVRVLRERSKWDEQEEAEGVKQEEDEESTRPML